MRFTLYGWFHGANIWKSQVFCMHLYDCHVCLRNFENDTYSNFASLCLVVNGSSCKCYGITANFLPTRNSSRKSLGLYDIVYINSYIIDKHMMSSQSLSFRVKKKFRVWIKRVFKTFYWTFGNQINFKMAPWYPTGRCKISLWWI